MAAIARLDSEGRIVLAAVGLLACAVGLLAGIDPRLAIVAALGVAFLLVSQQSLAAGLALFTLVLFLDLSPVGGEGAFSLTKVAGGALALSWLARVATGDRADRQLWARFPALTWLLIALLTWSTISYTWAEAPGVVLGTVAVLALNAVLFVIAFEALRTERQVRMVLGALLAGCVIAAVQGLIERPDASAFAYSPTSGSELGRLAGSIGDPNYLAALLVVGLVIALAFALGTRRSPAVAGLALVAGAICATGVFLTGSRGGLLALAGALVAAVLLSPRHRARMLLAAATVAVAGVGYFLYAAPPEARDRLVEADGGSGRTDVWTVGMRMFEDRPLTGVGSGNFRESSIQYLHAEPGGFEFSIYIVDQPAVAHNVYIEFMAELGIPGLILIVALLVASIGIAWSAARRFHRLGDHSIALLAAGVAVAIASLATAGFFLSTQETAQLWLLLAYGPAMLEIARRREVEADAQPAGDRAEASASSS